MAKIRFPGVVVLAFITAFLLPSGHILAAAQHTSRAYDNLQSFILNNSFNFSSASGTGMDNGATVPLDPNSVQAEVTGIFQHTIFDSSADGNLVIHADTFKDVEAQISQNTDGSYNIAYSQSSNSITTSFSGTLAGNQMTATYQQTTIGGNVVDDQEFIAGNGILASFTTAVTWITDDQIPAVPSGGQCQFLSDGGVSLSWADNNASGYHIHRYILGTNTEQDLGTTTSSSYTDDSPDAIQNANSTTGLGYIIYAVGSNGIESPGSLSLLVSFPAGLVQVCKTI